MTNTTSFQILIRFLILIIVGLFVLLLLSSFQNNPRNKFEVNSGIIVNNLNAIIVDKVIVSVSLETENTTRDATNNDIISTTTIRPLEIITRDEWLGQPATIELNDLVLPATRVIIAHTATEPCNSRTECIFRTRFIQAFHMDSRGFDDIAYNFVVGGDGAIYEGRGWDKEGAHTKGFNKKTICIAFIGTFIKIKPTDGQLNAAKLLIAEGVRLGKLTKDYQLYGHRQFIPSESPGDALYNIIKTWPNFSTVVSQE